MVDGDGISKTEDWRELARRHEEHTNTGLRYSFASKCVCPNAPIASGLF
jgi:hypothetical protein